MEAPFRSYSSYLKERYGRRVYRVSVDAGFTCPNRGSDRTGGCTYCDDSGSRAPYLDRGHFRNEEGIRHQVETAIAFLKRRYGAGMYLLYFQAFTNTYAPVGRLKLLYDFTLGLAPFRELIVSTRPDCVGADVARLLRTYADCGIDVWVELGLQSAHDATLRRIRRGHTVSQFSQACTLLKQEGLNVAAHLIFGLPGESLRHILRTTRFVASLGVNAVKIHNVHIPKGTELHHEFLKGEIAGFAAQTHLEWVIRSLEILPEPTIVMRLTCDTPEDRLVSPRAFWAKSQFYSIVQREMRRRGTWQGRLHRLPNN